MDRRDRKEIDSYTRFGVSRVVLYLFVFVAVAGVIAAVTWGVRVATSDVKGAGDAAIKINSGANRIAAQEAFEALYAQIQAYDKNLDQAATDKAAYPNDPFWAANYSGLVKTCNDAVLQYNADARKVSREKWLTDDLPYEIDQNDPRFDCKETAK